MSVLKEATEGTEKHGDVSLWRIKSLYDGWAPWYDRTRALWAERIGGEAEEFLEQEVLPRYLAPESLVLDLGCGTAVNLERFRRLGLKIKGYVGLDISLGMLAQAKNKGGLLCLGEAGRLPFPSETFDFILSTWLMSHLARPEDVVREALRTLKSGGHLACLFWTPPVFPWSLVMALAKRVFKMRCLPPDRVEGIPGQVLYRRFASDANTLLVWRKEKRKTTKAPRNQGF
ncbi:MAG: class I SAM-dependent methyltransferase [Anaerolineae bacterium]